MDAKAFFSLDCIAIKNTGDQMKTWTVCYRTGGTENFKWQSAFPVGSELEAMEMRDRVNRMGHLAYYTETEHLEKSGLPKNYNYSSGSVTRKGA